MLCMPKVSQQLVHVAQEPIAGSRRDQHEFDIPLCLICRELVEAPGLVQGRSVLELGAGVGLCGLLAAKLGASEARPPTT